MRKIIKFFMIISLLLSFLINPLVINAASSTIGTATGIVSVKDGPGDNYNTVATLSRGRSFTLVSNEKYTSASGCAANWYKIYYNGIERYICSSYVNLSNSTINYFTTNLWEARSISSSLNVREKANSSSKFIESIGFGTQLTILEEAAKGNGCDDKWFKISYYNNKTGYICSTFVAKYQDVTTNNEEYNQVLEAAGFPKSYWPYLSYLHSKHPNWTFVAIPTNLHFKDVIDGEEGNNYIQTSLDAYRTSSTPVEGSSWYRATNSVIAFYLDPRNFLFENSIFMFENLGYDAENHTKEVVKSVFGSGSLAGDVYVDAFLSAGAKYKISPIHLASRVKQEVGINGNQATSGSNFIWNGSTYSGFYNFFNIGAYGTNPLTRGLAYAAGLLGNTGNELPWNTIEKSINGGASFLANGYTSQGQYTLYLQKFNVAPNATYSRYTHQYMTNVNAPTAEGISTYKSYSDQNLLDVGFVFSIPVYKSMPEDATTLPSIGNTNNDLVDIKIDGLSLKNFDKDVISYDYEVSEDLTKVNLSATPSTSLSTVQLDNEVVLTTTTTSTNITVVSESGLSKTYTINITKVPNSELTIEKQLSYLGLKVIDSNLTSISALTTSNNLSNQILSKMPTATVNITFNGDKLSPTDNLTTGSIITITNNGESIKTYNIVIKGDTSGDGKISILDLLQTQKHILKTTLLTGTNSVAGDANYDNKITILDLLLIQKHILGFTKIK